MSRPLLISNGRLWSDGTFLPGTAILIDGASIVAIGGEPALRSQLAGLAHDEIDADGALVTPTFADAHIHAAQAGVEAANLDLSGAADADECLAVIAEHAGGHAGEWLVGGGWMMTHFDGGTPTARMLDEITGDRPTFLLNADHHGAWVNTAALRRAGIDDNTPDPPDGRIERDAAGRPAGTLHEGAADLIAPYIPAVSPERTARGIRSSVGALFAAGVTAWQEALLGDFSGTSDPTDGYLQLLADGDLTARVTGALWVRRDITVEGVPALVADLVARRDRNARLGFDTSTAKIMLDGVAENQTAALHDPYVVNGCDCGTGRGIAYFDRAVLFAVATALVAEGFALHFHAIGDRAITDALDAVEQLPDGLQGRRRHHIAHVQIVDPADIPRFARLGVTVNAQALWACNEEQMTELTVPVIGQRRAAWQYPFGSLYRSGADLAMGSDWPVSTFEPWPAIHVAVNPAGAGIRCRGVEFGRGTLARGRATRLHRRIPPIARGDGVRLPAGRRERRRVHRRSRPLRRAAGRNRPHPQPGHRPVRAGRSRSGKYRDQAGSRLPVGPDRAWSCNEQRFLTNEGTTITHGHHRLRTSGAVSGAGQGQPGRDQAGGLLAGRPRPAGPSPPCPERSEPTWW